MIVNATISEPLSSVDKVAETLANWLGEQCIVDQDKEHFWAIGLNTKLYVKYIEVVTLGTLDASLVHPREVFRMAIMHGMASILVAHNHPTGHTQPSIEDINVTERLAKAAKLLGIHLHDHLTIGLNGQRYSFAESLPRCLSGTECSTSL